MTLPQEQSVNWPCEDIIGRTLHEGDYRVCRLLGQGGVGNVYLALHTTLAIPLALKQMRADNPLPEEVIRELDTILLRDEALRRVSQVPDATSVLPEPGIPTSGGEHTDRFIREALILARLHHSALPTLYDYFFQDGFWYMVMDYIQGSSLRVLLRRRGPLPPLEALSYALQLCEVLDYLHRQSPPIFFRDLKPANTLVCPDNTIMLIDPGSACYAHELATIVKEGRLDIGSPGYIAPEQRRDDGLIDGRVDLYSLGIILYEMLSGSRAGTSEQLEALHCINPAISHVLSGLVKLATRPDPRQRFQSAYTFYLALERAYSIEERRIYQQTAFSPEEKTTEDVLEPHAVYLDEAQITEERVALLTLRKLTSEGLLAGAPILERRRVLREALNQARRERLTQGELELQLATVDESLKHRACVPLALTPRPVQIETPIVEYSEEKQQEETIAVPLRPARQGRCMVLCILFLILLLFLALALSWFYLRDTTYLGLQVPRPTHLSGPSTLTVYKPESVPTETDWQALSALPQPNADHAAVYVEIEERAYIYMSGGYRGEVGGSGTASADGLSRYDHRLYRYDIAASQWEIVNEHFPILINNAATVDEQGQIFFTAGYMPAEQKVVAALYRHRLDGGLLHKVIPPEDIAFGFAGGLLSDQRGSLYLTQGFMRADEDQERAGTGWYRYDIAANHWQKLAPLPEGLGYSLLTFDGRGDILLFGGAADVGQHQQSRDIYRYNIVTDQWSRLSRPMPQIASGMVGCAIWPGQIVLAGGYDPASQAGKKDVWLYDAETEDWRALPGFPPGGLFLGAAACDGYGHLYIVRGAGDSQEPTDGFWHLTLPPVRSLRSDEDPIQ